MKPPQDLIITALKAAKRNPKSNELFNRVLAGSRLYTFVRQGGRAFIVRSEIEGRPLEYAACFSNPIIAAHSLRIYSNIAGNEGLEVQIRPIQALKLFFSAARGGLAVCLNPKNTPEEGKFFKISEVKAFLAGPWALDLDHVPGPDGSNRAPRRSKQGRRKMVADESARLPIAEIDFDRPMTIPQLAAIFETSENAVIRHIADLERREVIDLESLSISFDDEQAAGSRRDTRYFDPLVAFHVGYQMDGARGDEFRQWQTRLLYEYWSEGRAFEDEKSDLTNQVAASEEVIQKLEAELREKDQVIGRLQSVPDGLDEAVNRLHQELARQNKRIAELTNDLQAAGEWRCPESVLEAKEAAEARYASRLVFHQRVEQSIKEFSLNGDLKAAHETVKMLVALAECLHPMKFEQGEFSEERFRDETGLVLSMTESKTSKREKMIEDSRTCFYQGQKILFYPHLKKTVQGVQMRLHFQFLDEERKILICHLGDHLPNAKTKYLK